MMETRAQPLHPRPLSTLRARPWISRLIATLGVALMTIGLYAPVAGRDVLVPGDVISRYSETWIIRNSIDASLAFLHLESMSLPKYLGFDAVYAAVTLGGLALIPLLWQPLSPQGTVRVRWVYASWLALLTLLAVMGLPAWNHFMSQPPVVLSSEPLTLDASYLLPGVGIFPLGVLASGATLALMLRESLPSSPLSSAPRTHWQRAAAFTLSAGVLVWGIGFYLMPEAITAACPPISISVTQFAHGACAGLDSDQVLRAASSSGLNPLGRLLFALGWNFQLLVAAGCITALGGWMRHLSVATLIWLAVWPMVAFGVALVALQGVGEIARQGFKLTYATGDGWHAGSGMIVTFIGIGLVVLGQIGLWQELAQHSKSRAG